MVNCREVWGVWVDKTSQRRAERLNWGVPIFFQCQRCTACCRWPGQVRLPEDEIARLAEFKQLSEFDFIQQFTRLSADKRGLALAENADGACIFLEGSDCAVQPVKPRQCREFPNLWNFPGFEKICRALPVDVSPEDYRKRVGVAIAPSHLNRIR